MTPTSHTDWESRWRYSAEHGGWLSWVLWPLSLVYRILAGLHRLSYRIGLRKPFRASVPVVVVGNLVVGGAGKTPATIALVRHLQQAGWKPGVISRGYGRDRTENVVGVSADSEPQRVGDEPLLVARTTNVPVFVARQRKDAALALLRQHPETDILVCDDGLQHIALHRDVAVAVFDDRGIGNGKLLPAGLLREPWPPTSSSPWRPDLLLVQRRTAHNPVEPLVLAGMPSFSATRTLAPCAHDAQGRSVPLANIATQGLAVVAGIARPEVFFTMLAEQRLQWQKAVRLPDHANAQAYEELLNDPAIETVLCTEKDAVKLFPQAEAARMNGKRPPKIWAIGLELKVESGFFDRIDQCLSAKGFVKRT